MTNPLLTPFSLPPFSAIKPEHVVPAVTKALDDCRAAVERAVAQGAPYTWENLCQPLAEVDDVLGRIFSPVSHLNSVKNSPELREAYEQTLPLLSEYSTWVGQHEGLYKAYRDLRDGDHYATLNTAQKKAVDNALRDFELSGIGLAKEQQKRYGEIAARLSELGNQYSNNVLDATMGWTKLVTDESELSGMPESALAAAKAQAEAKEQEGFLLTLDIPSYLPVMTYCDNQALREELYRRGISLTTAKNRSSIFTASATNSCAPTSRKTKRLTACSRWLSVFTVLPRKSVPMWTSGIRRCASSSCTMKKMNYAVASISISTLANINAAGRGWMTALARCASLTARCKSRSLI